MIREEPPRQLIEMHKAGRMTVLADNNRGVLVWRTRPRKQLGLMVHGVFTESIDVDHVLGSNQLRNCLYIKNSRGSFVEALDI